MPRDKNKRQRKVTSEPLAKASDNPAGRAPNHSNDGAAWRAKNPHNLQKAYPLPGKMAALPNAANWT